MHITIRPMVGVGYSTKPTRLSKAKERERADVPRRKPMNSLHPSSPYHTIASVKLPSLRPFDSEFHFHKKANLIFLSLGWRRRMPGLKATKKSPCWRLHHLLRHWTCGQCQSDYWIERSSASTWLSTYLFQSRRKRLPYQLTT